MAGRERELQPARESSEKPPALVFYADILGFADFVRARPADHVRRLLRSMNLGAQLQNLGARGFDSLMFSDSLVIWSTDRKEVSAATLDDLLAVASSLLVSAMANRMPLSGAIACGEFFVESRETHPLFFGKGLVAAFDAERAVKWIGINVAADTVRTTMSSARVEQGVRDLAWRVRESDGTLLVNPFLYLTRSRGESEAQLRARLVGQDTMLLVELHALRFLIGTLGADASSGRIVDAPAAKYLATVEFTRHVLGEQHFELLSRVAMALPDSSAWIESAY
jgi:hypothetical protein